MPNTTPLTEQQVKKLATDYTKFVGRGGTLICPITFEVMQDPVKLDNCTHNFEESTIRRWLENPKHQFCPTCKTPNTHYTPATEIKETVNQLLQLRSELETAATKKDYLYILQWLKFGGKNDVLIKTITAPSLANGIPESKTAKTEEITLLSMAQQLATDHPMRVLIETEGDPEKLSLKDKRFYKKTVQH